MLRLILRRLLLLLPTALFGSVLIFAMVQIIPGGAAETIAGEDASPQTIARIQAQLGLDRPLYEQYLGWLKSGIAQTPTQLGMGWCGEALGKEKASIIFEGNWVTGYMQDTFPKVTWKTVPMVKNKSRGNLGFTVSYSIAKDSKHKAQAFTLLSFLEGKTGMRIWSQASGYLPSRSDVKPPAGRAVFTAEAPATHPWQFAPKFSKVVDVANSELTAAYEGKETVAQALANIQAAASAALKH